MLSYEFVILEVNGASCEFGLDNIYWSGGSEILKVSNINVPANNFTKTTIQIHSTLLQISVMIYLKNLLSTSLYMICLVMW